MDKYVAALRHIMDGNRAGVDYRVMFCNRNMPTRDDLQRWDAGVPGSCVLVDTGAQKYHGRYPSATEAERDASQTHGTRIWDRLVPLMNLQNGSGFLKCLPNAIAGLVREIPHTYPDREIGQTMTWVYGMKALRAIFRPQNQRKWASLHADPANARLATMYDGFRQPANLAARLDPAIQVALAHEVSAVNEKYPYMAVKLEDVYDLLDGFTLGGYFRRMYLAGDAEGEILRVMSWWLDRSKAAEAMLNEARGMDLEVKRFPIKGSNAEIGIFSASDYFEAKHFGYAYLGNRKSTLAVGIVRMPTGGVVIMTSRNHTINLNKAFSALARREPGQWYLEGRFAKGRTAMAMNQSWQFTGVEASSFTDAELVSAINTLGKYLGRG